MRTTTKTAALLALAALALGTALPASATGDGSSADQRPVKEWNTFYLKATAKDGKVYLNWTTAPAKSLESGWNYWKVVRSTKNASPVYPNDGYIRYDGDRLGFTSYVDENPESSPAWYRVCAITDAARYCSNVVKVAGQAKAEKYEKTYEKPYVAPQPVKPEQPALSWAIKGKIDALAVNVKKGLDAKFGDDNAAKAAWLDEKIAQVAALKEKAPALVEYLNARLEYLRDAYRNSDVPADILNLLKIQ